MEARGARAPTRGPVGTPSERCARATGLPRSARSLSLAAVALAATSACGAYVEGNCVDASETRTLSAPFQGVRVQDGIQATVASGTAPPSLVVSGDANLLPYLHVEIAPDPGSVPSNVLRLWMEVPSGTFTTCIPPTAVLAAGELSYVRAEGDSHVSASGVATRILSVEASGKSNVEVAGPGGDRIQVVADDASVHARTYPVALGAQVDLTNGARAELHSDGAVNGSVGPGCTLSNFGTGACTAVVPASGTPPPTIACPAP